MATNSSALPDAPNTGHPIVIDSHGHFTTAPDQVASFRRRQLSLSRQVDDEASVLDSIDDDALRASIAPNQLRVLRERGGDMMLFSPQASAMGHHVDDVTLATSWARLNNDLIRRVTSLFPGQFVGVCQLPQTPSGGIGVCVDELRRCVEQLGFVGCNINPDPSGGFWSGPPMTDTYWFPVYEAMVALDVPGMIHAADSCNENAHTLGAHSLNADTTVFMQLLTSDLFEQFSTLRLVISHGGGAVPYHWGRYEGLAVRMGRPPARQLLQNVFFDTCVYHQPGIGLLHQVVETDNMLFASEMLGAVRGTNPATGSGWNDTKQYIDRLELHATERNQVFEENARRVYARLDRQLRGTPRR